MKQQLQAVERECFMEAPRQPQLKLAKVGVRECLVEMPSFRSIPDRQDSIELLGRIAAPSGSPSGFHGDGGLGFAFDTGDSVDGFEPVPANKIFSGGHLRPSYPRFEVSEPQYQGGNGDGGEDGTSAAVESEKHADSPPLPLRQDGEDMPSTISSSSSSASTALDSPASSVADDLEAVPAGTYCVWTPRSALPPRPPDLDNSRRATGGTAAALRRWRLRNPVSGRGSQSNEKDKPVFVAAVPMSRAPEATKKGEEKKAKWARGDGGKAPQMDLVVTQWLFSYLKGGGGAAAGERRRSFLSYRNNLLGIFASGAGRGF